MDTGPDAGSVFTPFHLGSLPKLYIVYAFNWPVSWAHRFQVCIDSKPAHLMKFSRSGLQIATLTSVRFGRTEQPEELFTIRLTSRRKSLFIL